MGCDCPGEPYLTSPENDLIRLELGPAYQDVSVISSLISAFSTDSCGALRKIPTHLEGDDRGMELTAGWVLVWAVSRWASEYREEVGAEQTAHPGLG